MLQILTLLGNTELSEKHDTGVCFACVSVNDSAMGAIHFTKLQKYKS